MDLTKQTLLLEYLISSVDTFAICTSIVNPTYFDPELRNAISFIQDYYEQYHTTPDSVQIFAETGVQLQQRDVTRDKVGYCSTEIESFCKRRAIEKAIVAAPKLIQLGDYGAVEELIKDAITISLHSDLGISLFEDPYSVLMRLNSEDSTVSTGWLDLDNELGGGMRRKEMILFSANSGGGKSITMSNLALNLVERGMNALYISLELSQDMVAKRFYGMVSGVRQVEILPRANEVAHTIESKADKHGEFLIMRLPTGSCANDIKSVLKEIELKKGYVPDILVVDYLDLMSPNERMSQSNVFEKDKAASEQLRDLGEAHNMFIVTASQQNRGAVSAIDLDHSHIAGGISKVNTTDVWISIIMSDQMRAEGVMRFQLMKTRSSEGVGHFVDMKWNGDSMRVTDRSGPQPLTLKKTSEATKGIIESSPGGSNLLNFLNN